MITLEQACENALSHFKNYWGETAYIQFVQETEDIWIITPDSDIDIYGMIPVAIDKKTGELKAYPTHRHFDVLEKAPKIKIPLMKK